MTDKDVRDALAGVGALGGGLRSDNAPLDAVVRAYQQHGEPVARGVAACLTDEDASIRGQAALFFEQFPDAPGAEALLEVWARQAALFDAENPWMAGYRLGRSSCAPLRRGPCAGIARRWS